MSNCLIVKLSNCQKMKAIQIEKERQMAVVDIPAQEMKSNEVLLRLEYVGFCGSDLSTYLGKNPMVRMPVLQGDETTWVVALVKTGADASDDTSYRDVLTVLQTVHICQFVTSGVAEVVEHNLVFVQRMGRQVDTYQFAFFVQTLDVAPANIRLGNGWRLNFDSTEIAE